MSVTTTAHLNFRGQAREALEFYQSVFGGQLVIVTYGDFGLMPDGPDADRVVFGQVVGEDGFRVMAYDVPGATGREPAPAAPTTREDGITVTAERFFLSVRGESVDEIAAVWAKLAVGATVVEAYGPAQWAPAFGMLTDRYGVTWILDVAAAH
jgi:PhnB protein